MSETLNAATARLSAFRFGCGNTPYAILNLFVVDRIAAIANVAKITPISSLTETTFSAENMRLCFTAED